MEGAENILSIIDSLTRENITPKDRVIIYEKTTDLLSSFSSKIISKEEDSLKYLYSCLTLDLSNDDQDVQHRSLLTLQQFFMFKWRTPLVNGVLKNFTVKAFDKNVRDDVKSAALKCIELSVQELILHDICDVEKIFADLASSEERTQIITILEKLSQNNNIAKFHWIIFLYDVVIDQIFNSPNEEIRKDLLSLAYKLLKHFPISVLQPNKLNQFKEKVKTVYVSIIIDLCEAQNSSWATLCTFLLKCLGKVLHNTVDVTLTNKILKILETIFRSKNIEDKALAYICWKDVIENSSLDMKRMTSNKQINLLLTPLKANLSRDKSICVVRFEAWSLCMHLIQSHSVKCLDDWLNFCFGPLDVKPFQAENDKIYGRRLPSLWEKMALSLFELLGHCNHDRTECVMDSSKSVMLFEKPIINSEIFLNTNFNKKAIITSVAECTYLMFLWMDQSKIPKAAECLWGSLLNVISQLEEHSLEEPLRQIMVYIEAFIHKSYGATHYCDYAVLPILNLFLTWKYVTSDLFRKIIFFPLLKMYINSDAEVFLSGKEVMFKLLHVSKLKENTADWLKEINIIFQVHLGTKRFKDELLVWSECTDVVMQAVLEAQRPIDAHGGLELNTKDKRMKIVENFLIFPIRILVSSDPLYVIDFLSKWNLLFSQLYEVDYKMVEVLKSVQKLHTESPNVANIVGRLFSELKCIFTLDSKELVNTVLNLLYEVLINPHINEPTLKRLLKYIEEFAIFYSTNTFYQTQNFHILYPILEFFCNKQIYSVIHILKCLVDNCPKFTESCPVQLKKWITDMRKSSNIEISRAANGVQLKFDEAKRKNSYVPRIPSMISLFGQRVESPISVRGSQLNKLKKNALEKSQNQKLTPNKRKNTFEVEKDDENYVVIDNDYQFNPDTLTSHQKEVLKKRRIDIPALYEDLTQSQSNSQFAILSPQTPSITDTKENSALLNSQDVPSTSKSPSPGREGVKLPLALPSYSDMLNPQKNESENDKALKVNTPNRGNSGVTGARLQKGKRRDSEASNALPSYSDMLITQKNESENDKSLKVNTPNRGNSGVTGARLQKGKRRDSEASNALPSYSDMLTTQENDSENDKALKVNTPNRGNSGVTGARLQKGKRRDSEASNALPSYSDMLTTQENESENDKALKVNTPNRGNSGVTGARLQKGKRRDSEASNALPSYSDMLTTQENESENDKALKVNTPNRGNSGVTGARLQKGKRRNSEVSNAGEDPEKVRVQRALDKLKLDIVGADLYLQNITSNERHTRRSITSTTRQLRGSGSVVNFQELKTSDFAKSKNVSNRKPLKLLAMDNKKKEEKKELNKSIQNANSEDVIESSQNSVVEIAPCQQSIEGSSGVKLSKTLPSKISSSESLFSNDLQNTEPSEAKTQTILNFSSVDNDLALPSHSSDASKVLESRTNDSEAPKANDLLPSQPLDVPKALEGRTNDSETPKGNDLLPSQPSDVPKALEGRTNDSEAPKGNDLLPIQPSDVPKVLEGRTNDSEAPLEVNDLTPSQPSDVPKVLEGQTNDSETFKVKDAIIDSPDKLIMKDIASNTLKQMDTAEMNTQSLDLLSTPVKQKNLAIPTSPIEVDTPTRTKELIHNTLDISPIKSLLQLDFNMEEKIQKTQKLFDLNSKTTVTNIPASSSSSTSQNEENATSNDKTTTTSPFVLNGRLNKLLGFLIPKTTPQVFTVAPCPKNSPSVATSSRVMRMMKNCGDESKKNDAANNHTVPLKSAPDIYDEKQILMFVRPIPSPLASPKVSILKRKAPDSRTENESPPRKVPKKVNFPDPPLTCQKLYILDEDEDEPAKDPQIFDDIEIVEPLFSNIPVTESLYNSMLSPETESSSTTNIEVSRCQSSLQVAQISQSSLPLELSNSPIPTLTLLSKSLPKEPPSKSLPKESASKSLPKESPSKPLLKELASNALLKQSPSKSLLKELASKSPPIEPSSKSLTKDSASKSRIKELPSKPLLKESASNSLLKQSLSKSLPKELALNSLTEEPPSKSLLNEPPSKSHPIEPSSKSLTKESASKPLPKESPSKPLLKESASNSLLKQSPSKSLPKELASKSLTEEPPSKSLLNEPPSKSHPIEPSSKSLTKELASNSLTKESVSQSLPKESPSKSLPKELASKSLTEEPPSKSLLNEPPSKSHPIEPSSKSLTKELASNSLTKESASQSLPKESPAKSLPKESPAKSLPKESPAKSLTKKPPAKSLPKESPSKPLLKESASNSLLNEPPSKSHPIEPPSKSHPIEPSSKSLTKELASNSLTKESASQSLPKESPAKSLRKESSAKSLTKKPPAKSLSKESLSKSKTVQINSELTQPEAPIFWKTKSLENVRNALLNISADSVDDLTGLRAALQDDVEITTPAREYYLNRVPLIALNIQSSSQSYDDKQANENLPQIISNDSQNDDEENAEKLVGGVLEQVDKIKALAVQQNVNTTSLFKDVISKIGNFECISILLDNKSLNIHNLVKNDDWSLIISEILKSIGYNRLISTLNVLDEDFVKSIYTTLPEEKSQELITIGLQNLQLEKTVDILHRYFSAKHVLNTVVLQLNPTISDAMSCFQYINFVELNGKTVVRSEEEEQDFEQFVEKIMTVASKSTVAKITTTYKSLLPISEIKNYMSELPLEDLKKLVMPFLDQIPHAEIFSYLYNRLTTSDKNN